MAASGKSFLADAGYGEQELDANSALMELDKGEAERGWDCLPCRAAIRAVGFHSLRDGVVPACGPQLPGARFCTVGGGWRGV